MSALPTVTRLLGRALDHKVVVVLAVSALFVVSLMFPLLGTELFPETDAGTFTINFRAPAGTRLELTTALAKEIEAVIRQVIPPRDLDMVLSNIGLAPSISAIYSPNSLRRLRVLWKLNSRMATASRPLSMWNASSGCCPAKFPGADLVCFRQHNRFSAQFRDAGADRRTIQGFQLRTLYDAAFKAQNIINRLPQVSQTFIPQESQYPTLNIDVDRIKAARLGVTQKQVVSSVITALNSNMYIAPSIWIDHENKNDYFLTAQYPRPPAASTSKRCRISRSAATAATQGMRKACCCATSPPWSRRNIRRRPTTIISSEWSTCWCPRAPRTWVERRWRSKTRSRNCISHPGNH